MWAFLSVRSVTFGLKVLPPEYTLLVIGLAVNWVRSAAVDPAGRPVLEFWPFAGHGAAVNAIRRPGQPRTSRPPEESAVAFGRKYDPRFRRYRIAVYSVFLGAVVYGVLCITIGVISHLISLF